jgi:prepilin-type N-terminal cleavage/methylation domain-containing protein
MRDDASTKLSRPSRSNSSRSVRGGARGARGARCHRAGRGFTLVELAIVVAIVGVLSVLAVVGYRKLTLSAKVSEARGMISAIRIAQEDYKVERGVYADIGDTTHCPGTGLATPLVKTQWNTACNGGKAAWTLLPVHADGPVQFGYATVASGTPPTYGFVNMAGAVTTRPWYVVHAQADLDGNGGLNTELVGTSWGSTIFSNNEGE